MSKEEWPTDADVTDVIDSYFYDYSMGNDEELNVELEHQREDMTTSVVEWFEKATLYDRDKAKIEAFEKCVDILGISKASANPHDILKAYDEIGEVLQPYVFNQSEEVSE